MGRTIKKRIRLTAPMMYVIKNGDIYHHLTPYILNQ
jgi:hypothetical protein